MAVTQFRQIFGLSRSVDATLTYLSVTMANWLVAPTNYINPLPTFTSRVPPAPGVIAGNPGVSWGVTSAELAALQAGTIVEIIDTFQLTIASITSGAVIENAASARYAVNQTNYNTTSQSAIAALGHIIGANLAADGVTWTPGP